MADDSDGQFIGMQTLQCCNNGLQQLRIKRAEAFVQEEELQRIAALSIESEPIEPRPRPMR